MPLTLTFALGQNQTFELRCHGGVRPLPLPELSSVMESCDSVYYPQSALQKPNSRPDLMRLGRELYRWLDGKEGWLRRAFEAESDPTLVLDLIQTSDARGLNPKTEKVALGLAHLPWELLADGDGFLLERQDITVLPVRRVQARQTPVIGQQNRPLRLLFMATAPDYPGIAPLQFEQEEADILEATQTQPLALIVEESGSVAELADLVQSYPDDYFDVFHLTGHGLIYTEAEYGFLLKGTGRRIADHTPCFTTEDELGNLQLTTVDDLARAFRNRFPRVIFLSGCHTGQLSNQGTVPSMAQALVKRGAAIVLGWARPVYDQTAIVAAKALYQALATGESVEAAVQLAQQQMIAQQCPDWHLLRIYRDTRPVAQLVTPLRTRGREKLLNPPAEQAFLDEKQQVKVASRASFVGRRRSLQRCLRALRETSDRVGVWIAGMGGLGKSTLAARLCTRVQAQRPEMQQAVIVGVVDEGRLLNVLSEKYGRFEGVPALLNQPNVPLKGRLQNFFEAIEGRERPLILVLDDFEQNIPRANLEDGSLRLSTAAYDILAALCGALEDNQAVSRLIVTCRYLKEDTLPPHRLHLERLVRMSDTDIRKKGRRFPTETEQKQAQDQRILAIADGNPRLLEWLVNVLNTPGLNNEQLLTRLEQVEADFRENILAETLLAALSEGERRYLAHLSVFQLPIEPSLVDAVTETEPAPLTKLTALSLVEQGSHPVTYRVTTVLAPHLHDILTEAEWLASYGRAADAAYGDWWEADEDCTESRGLELVRLALRADDCEKAVTVGDAIATGWVNRSRYLEAMELCQAILAAVEDYRILGTVARAEVVLGFVQNATLHYQQALDLCPEEDIKEKSATLHNMARVIADQGEIDRAMQLWNESLELKERINDVQGKAATLGNIARVIADQGEIARAMQL